MNQQVNSLSEYAATRNARRAERKARQAALDAALRAYTAARNEARANGSTPPNMRDFVPMEAK